MFMGHISDEVDLSQIDTDGFNIEAITPNILFEKLRKPLLEKYEETWVYKGKITPFFHCKNTFLKEHNDLYAVDKFIVKLWGGVQVLRGSSTLGTAVDQLVEIWMNTNKDNKHFSFIDLGKKEQKATVSAEI